MDDVGGGGGVPGVVQTGGYWRGTIPGTNPGPSPRPDLRLIYGILAADRFIRPFDWNISNITEV